jgi:hypothetical protein
MFAKNKSHAANVKALLACIVVIFAQASMPQVATPQHKEVVRLQPHSSAIRVDFGGKLLELINAPTIIYLPMTPPKSDSQGNPWAVDIKNLGPSAVTVVGTAQFSLRIPAGRSKRIFSSGRSYSSK